MLKIGLLGQPNTGKSTLFNRLAGVKARTSNLPGTTVRVAESLVRVDDEDVLLVDLPGTYSLTPLDPAQREVLDYLLRGDMDALVLVLDATGLARGLELVAEAQELGLPMVIALNLWDQVPRKGITIDVEKLSRATGVPGVPCSGLHGKGIPEVMRRAVAVAKTRRAPQAPGFSRHVENAIGRLTESTGSRFKAIKALEGVEGDWGVDPDLLEEIARELERTHGMPSWEIVAAERHHISMKIAEDVILRVRKATGVSARVDRLVMHPLWGSLLALLVFALFFWLVFRFGSWLEGLSVAPLEALFSAWTAPLRGSVWGAVVGGLLDGVLGAVGILLPYFIPLILLMSFLEDWGYLPRVAHLVDGLMHRIGLHGKAVVPFIMGYGCSVPAVAATRIMEHRRDRVLTGILAPLIPCGARTAIILGLVGYFMGFWWALFVYILNIAVVGLAGAGLSRLRRDEAWGMVMEIPPYRLPTPRSLGLKLWFQLREFLAVALPLLVLGSALMGLLDWWHVSGVLNTALSPFTHYLLGLPDQLSGPLVFGFFRKELALIMAAQALSVSPDALGTVMTPVQMMTYTVFAVLYVPCLATVLVTWRELGGRVAAFSALFSTALATVVALAVRLVASVFV